MDFASRLTQAVVSVKQVASYDHTRFVDSSLIGHAPFPFHRRVNYLNR